MDKIKWLIVIVSLIALIALGAIGYSYHYNEVEDRRLERETLDRCLQGSIFSDKSHCY